MVEGTVKWFNESKGFGFLSREGGPDVFVHHSEIKADGFRTLNEGDRVRFEVVDSPKGPRAASTGSVWLGCGSQRRANSSTSASSTPTVPSSCTAPGR